MRRHILFILLFVCSYAMAQEASLRGTVLNSATNEPVQDVLVQLKGLSLEARTGSDGSFFITKIDAGTHTLTFTSPNIMTMEFPVTIKALQVNDIGSYYVTVGSQSFLAEGSLNLIEEEALSEDSEIGDFNVSSMMTSSNDVYISNTTYNFSPMRFKLRGYENRYSDVYINGIRFNDQERGNFSYGLIGGLNDATRNKDNVAGYEHSNYTFGQIGGSTNINTNASNYAPGGKASLAYTNRAYNLRAMATYSTGLTSKGWAVTGSLGYRWSNEGFIDGTFYNSLGYFLSVEKVLNSRHSLSLTTFGSPTQRAQQSPNVQETMDLTGSNYYNSYWGWQDGEKRNSRIVTAYEPAAILSHKFQINKDNKLTTSFAYKYSMYGSTALNWFNGQDPRPDYYKYLPSYYTLDETVFAYRDAWQKNNLDAHCEDCDYFPNSKERRENARMTQVDWESLYRRNYLKSIDESISDVDARLSAMYMVEERHNDQQMTTLSSVLNSRLTDRITLTAGIEAGTTKGMHYKTMNDLLGSQYFIDIDQFALRDNKTNSDFSQNDLNNPNRKIYQGDRFGYDYNIYVHNANAWLQNIHKYNHWDIYYGFKVDYTSFYREGNMRNGRAPENSYGKGKEHNFVTQSSKLGVTYKPTGRHIFSANVSYSTLPPLAQNSYRSIRIKDVALDGLSEERVFSGDLSYYFTSPIFRARVSAFQTNFYDQAELFFYFYDGDNSLVSGNNEQGNTSLNYSLTGVNKMHRGIELGAEVKLNSIFTLSFAGTIAEYIYTNRPTATASYENGMYPDFQETVYLKNYYVGGTPQTAGTIGLHAFYNYWFLDLNVSGFDRTYVDPAPNRRTNRAIALIYDIADLDQMNEVIDDILNQEKFDGGFLVDFSIGKSIRLNRKYTLNINAQFNNILNNTKLKTGGFEQGRFDYKDRNVNKYPNKYYYAQGFNCFINVGLRF